MNSEVSSLVICWATRALLYEKLIRKAVSSSSRLGACTSSMRMSFRILSTTSSLFTCWRWLGYRLNCSMSFSSRVRLRICWVMLCKRSWRSVTTLGVT